MEKYAGRDSIELDKSDMSIKTTGGTFQLSAKLHGLEKCYPDFEVVHQFDKTLKYVTFLK